MKTTKLFFMAALALTFAACSNDDNDFENPAQQPAEAQGIPFTATISMGGDKATTRALEPKGSGGLTATWAEGEEVALIHNGIIDKVTVASVSGNDATISGTITTDADGADVTVIFPYSAVDLVTKDVKAGLLAAQDGTLATIAANYDVRKGTGKLKVDVTASLNGNVSLTNQFAIWKLTLDQTAKDLYITADGVLIAGAIRSSVGTEFYVAVPAVDSKTVAAVATDGSSNSWFFSKAGVSLATGMYYQSSPTMNALDTDNTKSTYMITGTSGVTIPDGKTVVLSGVTISGASIACSGDATIILMGANTVTADIQKAAIKIGGSGTTLTITGSGSLTATGVYGGAGIGTDLVKKATLSFGNIVINGGTVTATGGNWGAGIGTGRADGSSGSASITCGDITINGGTVIAQGVNGGAGIGTGLSIQSSASNTCGAITIGTGVISVTARKSSSNPAPNSIGKGRVANSGTQACGTITIGGTIYWDGSAYQNGGDTYLVNDISYPTAP